ncbi:hypothetical protein R3L49_04760, partial [Wolbachia endosymbiont of Zaprionus taronus]|nr:hypothetical protein [Wolbachia endosymbiont of Zaprionus taronus]
MTRLTLSDCFNTSYRDSFAVSQPLTSSGILSTPSYRDSFAVSQPLTRDPANKQRDDELLYRC